MRGDVAGRTKATRAATAPEAAFGPTMPENRTQNATGTVTTAATAVLKLMADPMTINAVPATARSVCARAFSRARPPKLAKSKVAKEPKAANVAICRLPTTWLVKANKAGITRVTRRARYAAGLDQTGRRENIKPAKPRFASGMGTDGAVGAAVEQPRGKCTARQRSRVTAVIWKRRAGGPSGEDGSIVLATPATEVSRLGQV